MLKSYISLEVRILLSSETKTFCSCVPSAVSGPEAAGQSCPICREAPAAAPILNAEALRKTYILIRGLGGEPIREAPFERSLTIGRMQEEPAFPPPPLSRLSLLLGVNAAMDIMFHSRKKRIRISEIRLEEDSGRLVRQVNFGLMETRMDYSTAGMPSIRLRTECDLEIGEETEVFLGDLRRRIQYLELFSPGERIQPMETRIRSNAYVALAPYPETPVSFVKLRNLNSFNFVWKAVNAELSRQEEILTAGGTVISESRLWNEAKNDTEPFQIRSGEKTPRYRMVEGLELFRPRSELLDALTVELPEARRNRFMAQYGLTLYQAEFVCDESSRADFFEKTAARDGVEPKAAAQWMASWLIKEIRRLGFVVQDSPVTPERFAAILAMLGEKHIHGSIAKKLITAVLEENREPDAIVRERDWEQITDLVLLEDVVKSVIDSSPEEVRRIREGDAGPIQYLTGLIMKKTRGLAEPTLVKEILRDRLSVSLIYVISMGGAISGKIGEDGAIECGDETVLRGLLAGPEETAESLPVRFESIQVGHFLSEEIVPSDWAALIEMVAEKLNSGTANGIVVAHGTDTLPYTAPLLYWLFANAPAPIVLASSSSPPGVSSEAERTMKKAVSLALGKDRGVYVVHGGRVLSPLNLKYERLGGDCFRNWNMTEPVFSGTPLLTGTLEADRYVLSQLLEEAVNSICVFRIYPGLRSDYLVALMDKGVKNFFLELFDTGTAGFREGPYSLKRVFTLGKRRGARFYCSSQQEGIVNFSGYATSRELWKEGAVPLGVYTTETAVARFLAASIIADSDEERAKMMEADRDFGTSGETPRLV